MRTHSHSFHSRSRARSPDYIEPGADRAAPFNLFTDPGHRQILAWSLSRVRRATENPLLVFVDLHHDGFIALAANNFFAPLVVEPAVAPSILPTGRTARAAVFNEKIAGIGVHIGHAPREPARASHRHDRTTGQRRPHRVFTVAPTDRNF